MHNNKNNMEQLKCPDCGQLIDNGLETCPNCGCPTKNINSTTAPRTTDTGYTNEKTIKVYANIIYWIAVILGIIAWIISIIISTDNGRGSGFALSFFVGGIILAIYILIVYVWRAFIRTFANISINLHELNMKKQ